MIRCLPPLVASKSSLPHATGHPNLLPMNTPLLFLIHRRPELTRQVFAAVRQARPATLLIAADGPMDDPKCRETREVVLSQIDWPCRVEKRLLAVNTGCKTAVSSALDWAFELCERLIILEDDCLPHASFFPFCDELLDRYQEVPDVMQICGSNLTRKAPDQSSYLFSRFGPIWGWATWRRAWRAYDVKMEAWPSVRKTRQMDIWCPEPFEAAWRREVFDSVYRGAVDTWDYQWAFAKLRCGGLNIVPAVNLVSNIGFGPYATHTHDPADARAAMQTQDIGAPLVHPPAVEPWLEGDRAYLTEVVGLPRSAWSLKSLRRRLRSLFRR